MGFDDPRGDFQKAVEREKRKQEQIREKRVETQKEWDKKEEDRMKAFLSSIGKSMDDYR